MNLGRLEDRILHRLDEDDSDPEDVVAQEITRFEAEIDTVGRDDDAVGQARLTDGEIERLPMGNQHTKWNVVRWQAVKAAAIKFDVPDWTAKVDPSLTYEENIDLMRREGNETTMKELTYQHP